MSRLNSCRRLVALMPLYWVLSGHSAMAQIPCQTSQLLATEDRKESDGIDGGVGHHAMTIAILNRSASSCILRGMPTLELSYTATHRPFAVPVCQNCIDYLFPRQPVTAILLKPKQFAYVILGYNINDGNGECTEADPKFGPQVQYSSMTLSLYLPDQRRSPLTVKREVKRDAWRSCGVIDITPFLKQPPVDGFLPDPADRPK